MSEHLDATGQDPARRASIKDVAARAGVSWRTVSNVIHGHRYLRPETKAKVEAAIAELGYRPRLAARQLRSGKSNVLALALPYIAHPYFASLAHAIGVEAERLGYFVLIDETHAVTAREERVAKGYPSLWADGIIFSPLAIDKDSLVGLRDSTPLVLLGEHISDAWLDYVTIDNAAAAREATEHLLAIGRRRIAFLGYRPPGTLGTADVRLEGYRQALAAAGIPYDPSLLIVTDADYSREQGYARILDVVPHIDRIDALICANDLLAIGALRAFRERGVAVPDDVPVIGWDNTPDGAYSTPALTSVAPDTGEIARAAVELVTRRMVEPGAAPVTRIAPHRLVIRESTVAPGGPRAAGKVP